MRGRNASAITGLLITVFLLFSMLIPGVSVASTVTIDEYTIPTTTSEPSGITTGPDGALWFTEQSDNKIGRVTAGGSFTEYTIPTATSIPRSITLGPDGALWFTEYQGNKIGRITTGGTFTEYTVPTGGSGPWGITTGPDGALWFTEWIGNKIGRITTGGSFTEYTVPTAGSGPRGITSGPDGALWFTENDVNRICRMTTGGVFTTEYFVPTANSGPQGITSGTDGALWFTESNGNKIGRITGWSITEYTIPTATSVPLGITTGPDGALWFTEYQGNKIGRITTSGTFTEYTVPTGGSGPLGITTGPDKALWFAEVDGNKIGRAGVTYVVNASVSSGQGTVSPLTQNVALGGNATVNIDASTGWVISAMSDNGSPVTVTNPYHMSYQLNSLAADHDVKAAFTAVPPPTVTSITPDSGTRGTTVEVTNLAGSNFSPTPTVKLNKTGSSEITATNVALISPAKLTCRLPIPSNAATGPYSVVVTNPDGQSATKDNAFTVTGEAAHPTWYLAEGTNAAGFWTYITIENPNPSQVVAQVTYMGSKGAGKGPDITLPPMSQATLNTDSALHGQDFSTKVTCKQGKTISVDRTMIWTGPGAPSQEAHSSIGVTSPAKTWYLPEGSSNWNFECWTLLQNPNGRKATVTLTYMIEGKGPRVVPHEVNANSRDSFSMEKDLGGKYDASIKVQSDVPVIPERAMYRNSRREGHESIGTTSPSRDYYLAEGSTAHGFTTFILVQNPNAGPVDVTLTYMTTSSGVKTQTVSGMPANSRKTVNVNENPGMAGMDFSTKVHGTKPIIAERSMYWGAGTPSGEACHDSIGLASPHGSFYFPDGQTSNNHETYTLVMNPNPSSVKVEITCMTQTGRKNKAFTDTLRANSRKTYPLKDKVPDGRAAIMVTSKTSGKKIIAERSMYWNSKGAGTDTIGGYSE